MNQSMIAEPEAFQPEFDDETLTRILCGEEGQAEEDAARFDALTAFGLDEAIAFAALMETDITPLAVQARLEMEREQDALRCFGAID
jgi:hypothetical protein